jgi:hypothetical protein
LEPGESSVCETEGVLGCIDGPTQDDFFCGKVPITFLELFDGNWLGARSGFLWVEWSEYSVDVVQDVACELCLGKACHLVHADDIVYVNISVGYWVFVTLMLPMIWDWQGWRDCICEIVVADVMFQSVWSL